MTNGILCLIAFLLFVIVCEISDVKNILRSVSKTRDGYTEEGLDEPQVKIKESEQAKEVNLQGANEFSATAPVRIPWHIRRRELEEAARSKRKKLESFQEYV